MESEKLLLNHPVDTLLRRILLTLKRYFMFIFSWPALASKLLKIPGTFLVTIRMQAIQEKSILARKEVNGNEETDEHDSGNSSLRDIFLWVRRRFERDQSEMSKMRRGFHG